MECIHQAETLKALNSLCSDWANQFDSVPVLSFSFTRDREGMVCINGEPICFLFDVDVNRTFIDAEYFGFYTLSGDEYRLHVDWPFQGEPRVTHISHYSIRELK